MAAGVKIRSIEDMLGSNEISVIRIMPNLAVAIGEGTILWCANNAAKDSVRTFIDVMGAAGVFTSIDEERIDAGSAISGCGPAFAYMFIDALADGGAECGLTREEAIGYAAQALIGAARMVQENDKPPKQLRDEVCSPGGSTIEGVKALENGAFSATVASAVKASYKKTCELGK